VGVRREAQLDPVLARHRVTQGPAGLVAAVERSLDRVGLASRGGEEAGRRERDGRTGRVEALLRRGGARIYVGR
jgi:hypothetical protein